MSGELVVAIPTFVASSLSFVSCAAISVLYWLAPPVESHPRHYMVWSLLLSDLINSLNNTISGGVALYAISRGSGLVPGPACTANAVIGQFTVQATDFNILLMSIVVLLTVTNQYIYRRPSRKQIAMLCVAPWIPGLITANIALGLDAYGPTSGNWCWISAKHVTLRYALTHGWRIAIFLITIGIYTYVYIRLTRTYGNIWAKTNGSSRATDGTEEESQLCPISSLPPNTPTTNNGDIQAVESYTIQLKNISPQKSGHTTATAISTIDSNDSQIRMSRNKELRRFLLLNGYPILWILLWIPGMANRASELAHGKSPIWLQALQATTQLVGLANVLTYALTEKFVERLRKRFGRTSGFARTT